jgi:hypothetical protein
MTVELTPLRRFPLLLLSAANPSNSPNLITAIELDVGVSGWDPFFRSSEFGPPIAPLSVFSLLRRRYPSILPDDARDTQFFVTSNFSEVYISLFLFMSIHFACM